MSAPRWKGASTVSAPNPPTPAEADFNECINRIASLTPPNGLVAPDWPQSHEELRDEAIDRAWRFLTALRQERGLE